MPNKTISALAAAAALALGVAACGGSDSSSSSSSSSGGSASSSGPATGTITIWARDTQKTFMSQLVDAYNKSHKAQAKLSIIPSAQFVQKFGTAAASGSAPGRRVDRPRVPAVLRLAGGAGGHHRPGERARRTRTR